jgi:hypothetical protein
MATLPSSALDDIDVQASVFVYSVPVSAHTILSILPLPLQASGRHISGSMTSNYNQHRREYAAAVGGRPVHPAGGQHGPGGVAAPIKVGVPEPAVAAAEGAAERRAARAAASSDDKVFQSFRKAEIHRNR